MSLLGSLSEGLRSLFRKKRVEEELDEELRSFLEMAVEEKTKQGGLPNRGRRGRFETLRHPWRNNNSRARTTAI